MQPERKKFTLQELQTPEELYIVMENKVYNLKAFASTHPGGPELLKRFRGKDATKFFNRSHTLYGQAFSKRDEYEVGVLDTAHMMPPLSPRQENTHSLWDIRARGCFPSIMVDALPGPWHLYNELADKVPTYTASGRFRKLVRDHAVSLELLSKRNIKELDESQLNRLHALIGFISSAFVRGSMEVVVLDPSLPTEDYFVSLPHYLSSVWINVSALIHRQPMLDYAGCVLNNWGMAEGFEHLDLPSEPEHVRVRNTFTGTLDETWFYKVHILIEAHLAKVINDIRELYRLIVALERDNRPTTTADLETISEKLKSIAASLVPIYAHYFKLMIKACEPLIFFRRIRHYLTSWTDVEYEGYGKMTLKGATGAQSSLLRILDAFYGIAPPTGDLKDTLDDFALAVPVNHLLFSEDLKKYNLRNWIKTRQVNDRKENFTDIVNSFNAGLEEISQIRTAHLSFVDKYISALVLTTEERAAVRGTGGTKLTITGCPMSGAFASMENLSSMLSCRITDTQHSALELVTTHTGKGRSLIISTSRLPCDEDGENPVSDKPIEAIPSAFDACKV